MHHLASVLSTFSLQIKISYQNVSYCTRKRPCFHLFSYSSKSFLIPHNACFRWTLFSSISLQFQIVSDTTRMHTLETLFSFFLYSSKSFQIPPECMLKRHCICVKNKTITWRAVIKLRKLWPNPLLLWFYML